MKNARILFAIALACTFAAGTLVAADKAEPKPTCCEKAAKDGKECTHKCCVAAHREGKSCEKCNPDKQDLKKADKAKK